MKNIVIIGAGGFGNEVLWVAQSMMTKDDSEKAWNVIGFADDNQECDNGSLLIPYLGSVDFVLNNCEPVFFHCAIGSNVTRKNISESFLALGWKAATLIHPSVIIAPNVGIGEGTYIGAGSILCPNAKIGNGVIINTRVAVGHDAVIADYSQLCPGAQINGCCDVGVGALVGSNASIHPGKKIGEWATVASNSFVVRNVRNNTTVIGVPAVKI